MNASVGMDKSLVSLSKKKVGGLREVISLSVPIMLVLLSGSMIGILERIFLAKYSLEAMEASVSAIYLCRLFQLPCVSLALFTQVFVATYAGAKQFNKIGGCVWQMIWFSFLSLLITLPISFLTAPLFFKGTDIEHAGSQYFYALAAVNCLYPLGAVLSSFFLGRGKSKFVIIATVLTHLFNVGLDLILIFGIEGLIPSLGVLGAAIGTAISQGFFCIILFSLFIRKSHRELYGVGNYAFNFLELWSYVRVGLPRALGRIMMLGIGAATIRLITSKGGDYLIVFSIGASIAFFLSFLGEGIHQAILTLVSHRIGANQLHLKGRILQSTFQFLGIISLLLSIPLIFFPDFILQFFFAEPLSDPLRQILYVTLCWVWLQTLCYISQSIFIGFLFAMKDTRFYLLTGGISWLTSFLPMYYTMHYLGLSPDKMWIVMSAEGFIFSIIYCLRLRYIQRKHFVFKLPQGELGGDPERESKRGEVQ